MARTESTLVNFTKRSTGKETHRETLNSNEVALEMDGGSGNMT